MKLCPKNGGNYTLSGKEFIDSWPSHFIILTDNFSSYVLRILLTSLKMPNLMSKSTNFN